jgi:tetratricopeptide (TPR) repeat protein
MDIKRYFDILNLHHTASIDELKRTYRTLVRTWHPDHFSNSNSELKQVAEEKLKEINVAYENLKLYLSFNEHKNRQIPSTTKPETIVKQKNHTATNREQDVKWYTAYRGTIIAIFALGFLVIAYSATAINQMSEHERYAGELSIQKADVEQSKPAGSEKPINTRTRTETESDQTLKLANQALQQQQFAQAVTLIEEALESERANIEKVKKLYIQGLQQWAASLFDTDPEKSKSLLNKAIRLSPENAKSHFYFGKLYTKLKDYPKATTYYSRAVELDPSYHESLFNLGFVYAMVKDYPAAERAIKKAIDLSPPYVDEAYFNLAMVQNVQGRRVESIKNLERALVLNPKNLKAKKYLLRFKKNSGTS